MFHRLFGLAHSDPSRDAVLLASVKELSDGHLTQHTSLLDVLEDLPYGKLFFHRGILAMTRNFICGQ
jgi:hypothetical protein